MAEPTRRGGKRHAGRRGPSRRALVLWAAAALVVAVGAGVALMLPARSSLLEARRELLAGRNGLLAGDPTGAGQAFERAEDAFRDARSQLGNPLTRLASFVPLVGRTPDAVTAMADAGELIARAGDELARGIERLPDGLGALAPSRGVIQLQGFEELAPPLARTRELVVEADRRLRAAARTWIPDSVADPLFLLQEEVTEARQAVVAADALVHVLPSFLGAEGPKRYFVAAQNPAELRGTGGLIGSYAILAVEDGRLGLSEFHPIQTLNDAVGAVESPNPDYDALYIRWGGAGFWSNLNRTPDFPSAATAIERLYQEVQGIRLDGVIASDPFAFAELLAATGPAEIPGVGVTVDSDNVVPFVTNEAYLRFPDSVERKRILGDVAGQVLGRFLDGRALQDPLAAGRALIEAAAGGHLRLHAVDPATQQGFDAARLSGRLLNPPGDYLAVIVNNNGGNKIDFYLDRTIRYEVRLGSEGTGEGHTVVRMGNEAPSVGLPAYIIGPFPLKDEEPGENVSVLQTYCARGCHLQAYEQDGAPGKVEQHAELGHPVVLSNVRLPSGGERELAYRWTVPQAWSGDAGGGTYRLTFQGQPGIRPSTLVIDIRVPPGMRILHATEGLHVVGDRAVWRGPAGDLESFEVEFYRPLFSFTR